MCSENYRSEVIAAEAHTAWDKVLVAPLHEVPTVPFLALLLGLGEALSFRVPGFRCPVGLPAPQLTQPPFSDPVRTAAGSRPIYGRAAAGDAVPHRPCRQVSARGLCSGC